MLMKQCAFLSVNLSSLCEYGSFNNTFFRTLNASNEQRLGRLICILFAAERGKQFWEVFLWSIHAFFSPKFFLKITVNGLSDSGKRCTAAVQNSTMVTIFFWIVSKVCGNMKGALLTSEWGLKCRVDERYGKKNCGSVIEFFWNEWRLKYHVGE